MSGLRTPESDNGSSSPEALSAAFMLAKADGDGDHGVDAFLGDDSSSPSPESERPVFVERRPPSKLSTGTSRKMAAKAARSGSALKQAKPASKPGSTKGSSSSSSSKSGDGKNPQVSSNPIIPKRADDWEPWKGILHELYITQNRILRDIILIMETTYNLRATPKMYKNQFSRWRFFKYSIKQRPRTKAEREAAAKEAADEMALVMASPKSIDAMISPLMHSSNKARIMQSGLATVRDFLSTYINIDPTASQDMVVVGYQDPCFRYFKVAMDLFDHKENVQGGLLLRRAFLQMETLLSTMSIKSFSDLCFLIPHLLIESGRTDILSAYLRYLSGLVVTKFGSHPISNIIATFADLIDEPETMMRYVMTLTKVNADTLNDLKSAQPRTRKWARNQYLATQHTLLDMGKDGAEGAHPHHMMRVEAQSVYWAQHLIMQDPESDELCERWLKRDFPSDFGPRVNAYVDKVKQLGEAGILPPTFAKMIECLYIGWLNDYYETIEDWPKMFEYGRRGLDMASAEQYQLWSVHLEDLMRKHGSKEEADEMRKRRLEHEWFEELSREVEDLTVSLD
ncbi:hypothetical protein OQA88_1283 [Cercophora sp. LCS_1]